MKVYKSDKTYEEYNPEKIIYGICEAYRSTNEKCQDELINSIVSNLYVYDKISTKEIRKQVEDSLMSINKKVAKAYIERYKTDNELKDKDDFISDYIKASNASTGSKYDSNANVSNKNIVTLGQEMYKINNIRQNRYIMKRKIKSLYNNKLANQYVKDLESHVLYKHDETAIPGMPYTYSAKEVVEVKYNGRHLLIPFDLLWDVVEEDEILVNEVDDVWQKYPKELYVKDKDNYFTHVSALTKKYRKRDLVRVKTAFGEDVVVTDNHPMIIDKDDINNTIEAIKSEGCSQFKINDKLEFDGKTIIDMSQCPDIQEFTNEYCINYSNQPFKRFVDVDEELGYIVGFFVGDGNYNNNKNNGSIVFTQKDRAKLVQLNDILFKKFGIVGNIRYKRDKFNCYNLTVSSNALWWVLSCLFKIQDKSENKTLPYNLLEYNEKFANGLLGGIIDSDGSVNDSQLSIRLSSRAAIIQITSLLRHFGYGVGNTMQNLPFSNNNSFKTNYTLWGVNCSVRSDSQKITMCDKFSKVRTVDTSLKYKIDGETTISKVARINENDSFLQLNEYIYDITTDTRSFAMNNLLVHNCVSITMYPFLVDGLKKLGGQSKAPTDLKSYCGEFINLVYSVSSQFAGACATSEFLLYMDYFIRKDYGDDYLEHLDDVVELNAKRRTLEKVIENCFQQVVHSMNMPAGNRGYQTVFWNVGYFDKPYFDGVFGEFVFPDGTKPKWETLSWLQKKFMRWFNEERNKYVLTFPVETMAMLTDGHDIVDKEYRDFTAQMWADGHSFFCYLSDSPDSLSSCCFGKEQKVIVKINGNIVSIPFGELYEQVKGAKIQILYNGKWSEGVTIKLPNRKMYKVVTENDKELIVSDNHINLTYDGEKETYRLTTNDYLMINNHQYKNDDYFEFMKKNDYYNLLNNSKAFMSYDYNDIELAETLMTILGVKSIISKENLKYSICLFNGNDDIIKTRDEYEYVKIKSIEEVDYKDDIYCFEMDNQDEPYFTLQNGIVTHNCRLRNSLKDNLDEHNHTTHQFSMGTASVATGSKSVMTINLNRVIQNAVRKYFKDVENIEIGNDVVHLTDENKNNVYEYIKEELTSMTERVHKYQKAFNEIVKDFLNANMLDVYSGGFIDMKKQYLTVGVNGLTDAAEFLGIEIKPCDEYKEFVNVILETINICNAKDKTKELMFNTEFVPGENLSNKNYNWDKRDGYFVSNKHKMYSSYFFNPEDETLNVIDKMKLHGGEYVKYLDGGSANHVNLKEHLSFEQYKQILKIASEYGTNYFTFNVRNTVCNDCGFISKHTLHKCPMCGSENLDYLTRIIGYLKRVSSFSEARQEEEHERAYN